MEKCIFYISAMFTILGTVMACGLFMLGGMGFGSLFMWTAVMIGGALAMDWSWELLEQFEEEEI